MEGWKDGRASEALEAITDAEALVDRYEQRWCSAELRGLRGILLAALGAESCQVEATFSEAIQTAKQQKSAVLLKRAKTSCSRYHRQRREHSRSGNSPALAWGSLCARPAMARLNRKGIPGDGGDVIPIQSRNERRAHFSGTNRFAFVMISAVSKSEFIHFPDHSDDSFVPFRLALRQEPQVGSLGGYKKHSGRVWASRHASAAPDTSGCFHGKIRIMLGNRQRVGLGRRTGSSRDITTGFNDVIESAAIHREVLDYRESSRPERLIQIVSPLLNRRM